MTVLIVYLILLIVATAIGSGKNRPFLGFVLGLFLGLIGIVIIAVMPVKPRIQVQS